MKVVIQRVKEAKVEVENKVVGKIEKGFLVFLGITHTDTKEQADYLVKKLCNLRVFTDFAISTIFASFAKETVKVTFAI